jgi:hypothetical protein
VAQSVLREGTLTLELFDRSHHRYANDADMNRELKEVSRWNDPAANFLTVRFSSNPFSSVPSYLVQTTDILLSLCCPFRFV